MKDVKHSPLAGALGTQGRIGGTMRTGSGPRLRSRLIGVLVLVGAMTAALFGGTPGIAAASVRAQAARADAHVNWAVAGRPRGFVFKHGVHGVQGVQGVQPRSGLSGPSRTTSTNPECQAFGPNPPCDPPLLFTADDPVMGSSSPGHVTLTPVYWAPAGYSFPASYKSIINTYLADVAAASGTTGNVFAVATEYYQKLGANPNQYIQYSVNAGAEVDVSAAYPAQDATTGCTVSSGSGNTACVADGSIQTQLQTTLHADSLPVDDSHLYLVFFPPNVETCQLNGAGDVTPCSVNSYCGYHGAFQDASANNAPAIYADMPYGDPSGCGDPYNGTQAPNGNSYADTEISVTSHEASESITDWGMPGGTPTATRTATSAPIRMAHRSARPGSRLMRRRRAPRTTRSSTGTGTTPRTNSPTPRTRPTRGT